MDTFRKLFLKQEGLNIVPIAPNYREIQENKNIVYGCMGILEVDNESEYLSGNTHGLSMITIAIITTVFCVIIISITLIVKYRNESKMESNITKSNSVNVNENNFGQHPNENNDVISDKLHQVAITRYDTSPGGNRMSIDI